MKEKLLTLQKTPTIFSQVTDAAAHCPHQLFNASVNSSLRSAKITNNLCEFIGLYSRPSIHLQNEMHWIGYVHSPGADRVWILWRGNRTVGVECVKDYKALIYVLILLACCLKLRRLTDKGKVFYCRCWLGTFLSPYCSKNWPNIWTLATRSQ